MKIVHIRLDPFDQATWYTAEVDDVCAYLKWQFRVFPANARIYHQSAVQENDITPKTESDIERLQQLDGVFYVVIYPTWAIVPILYYAIVAVAAIYSVYMIMTMPKPSQQTQGSSNNELQGRSNQARLGGRKPDIYGTVRAYPDLAGVIYNYYSTSKEDREIEECIMVIGHGYYQIHDARDSETSAEGIQGMDVSIYDPNTSITGTPIYQVGTSFTALPLAVTKSDSINGQSLKKPNDDLIIDNTTIYFETAGVIKTTDSGLDFTEYFSVGDGIEITGAVYGEMDQSIGGVFIAKDDYTLEITTEEDIANYATFQSLELVGAVFTYTEGLATHTADLSGLYQLSSISRTMSGSDYIYVFTLVSPKQVNYNWNYVTVNSLTATADLGDSALGAILDETYSISAISTDQITLANASIVNPDWLKLDALFGGSTLGISPEVTLGIVENKWVGWFMVDDPEATRVSINLYFPQGLYTTTDSGNTRSGWIEIAFQYQTLDQNNNPTSSVEEVIWRVFRTTKNSFGVTYRVTLPNTGKFRFRMAKIAEKDWNRPVNECKVKDVYATHTLNKSRYADDTIVRTRQVATDGALSLKERKFNALVTRKLKVDGTGALVATRDAGQILMNMALDQYIGRRTMTEIDVAQIKATIAEVQSYFGSTDPTEFCYTFDDAGLSFEEQAGMVASAIFCECYRFGNKLRLKFEKPQINSVLLFNHRNKVPGSEKRTYTFGIPKDYDGVTLEYTSPDDDTRINYQIYLNKSTGQTQEGNLATNPLEIKTSGIRNHAVAKTRAWREWNKLLYREQSCEFTGLDESNLLIRNDSILVADNTLQSTQDGEVVNQDGLTLTLSQDVQFTSGEDHYCYLQLSDGSVDMIQCTPGATTNEIILARAPLQALVIDHDRYVKTLYSVVHGGNSTDQQAFMLTEMSPNDQMTNKLTCINYTDNYYRNDHDFI